MTRIVKNEFTKMDKIFRQSRYTTDSESLSMAQKTNDRTFEVRRTDFGEVVTFILDQKQIRAINLLGDASKMFQSIDRNKLKLEELWWNMAAQDYYFLIRNFPRLWKVMNGLPSWLKCHLKMMMEFRTQSTNYELMWLRNENFPTFLKGMEYSRYAPNLIQVIEEEKKDNFIKLKLFNYKENIVLFSVEEYALPRDCPPITKREKQIIDLLALGNDIKKMSETLGISLATVKGHRSNLLRKFNVSNSIELLRTMATLDVISFP